MTNVRSSRHNSSMATYPISSEVASAVARFFDLPSTPAHSELEEIFSRSGLLARAPKNDENGAQMGKMKRVRAALSWAADNPSPKARTCVDELLASLRASGVFAPSSTAPTDLIAGARRAFRNIGWDLDTNGRIGPLIISDIESAERRPVIELQIERMRNAPSDGSLLIGTAKEMLETSAKHVIEAKSGSEALNADFTYLMYHAKTWLQLEPKERLDADERQFLQSLWSLAESINLLRKRRGTGHGPSQPPDIDPALAAAAVQSAGVIAQLMLTKLDSR